MQQGITAFKKTYCLKGGAAAFWIMVAGCILALAWPYLPFEGFLKMAGSIIPCFFALLKGQQFCATMAHFMMEDTDKKS